MITETSMRAPDALVAADPWAFWLAISISLLFAAGVAYAAWRYESRAARRHRELLRQYDAADAPIRCPDCGGTYLPHRAKAHMLVCPNPPTP